MLHSIRPATDIRGWVWRPALLILALVLGGLPSRSWAQDKPPSSFSACKPPPGLEALGNSSAWSSFLTPSRVRRLAQDTVLYEVCLTRREPSAWESMLFERVMAVNNLVLGKFRRGEITLTAHFETRSPDGPDHAGWLALHVDDRIDPAKFRGQALCKRQPDDTGARARRVYFHFDPSRFDPSDPFPQKKSCPGVE